LRIRHVNAQQIESKLICQTTATANGNGSGNGNGNRNGNENVKCEAILPLI